MLTLINCTLPIHLVQLPWHTYLGAGRPGLDIHAQRTHAFNIHSCSQPQLNLGAGWADTVYLHVTICFTLTAVVPSYTIPKNIQFIQISLVFANTLQKLKFWCCLAEELQRSTPAWL